MGGDGPWVEMGIPRIGSMKKFAYARVMDSNTTLEYIESEKGAERIRRPPVPRIARVDFIKCDVGRVGTGRICLHDRDPSHAPAHAALLNWALSRKGSHCST